VSAKELVEEIREDNRSGAVILTLKAAEAFQAHVRTLGSVSFLKAKESIADLAFQLIQAKPVMASIFNLANAVLLATETARVKSVPALCHKVEETTEEFARSLQESTHKIATQATDLIKDGVTIMTISFSSTVLESFKKAKGEGKDFRVICLEGRPMLEGVELARQLSALGIKVTLIADALGPSSVSKADLILVGGDALSREGLVNKIGTYGLALAAQAAKVDFIALLGTEKIFPAKISALIPKKPKELLAEVIEHVTVCNRYFEITPLPLISKIITEEGEMDRRAIEKRLKKMVVHETLRAFASGD